LPEYSVIITKVGSQQFAVGKKARRQDKSQIRDDPAFPGQVLVPTNLQDGDVVCRERKLLLLILYLLPFSLIPTKDVSFQSTCRD
jgi:hypothetical protein